MKSFLYAIVFGLFCSAVAAENVGDFDVVLGNSVLSLGYPAESSAVTVDKLQSKPAEYVATSFEWKHTTDFFNRAIHIKLKNDDLSVLEIWLYNSQYKMKNGLSVGSNLDQLRNAYGNRLSKRSDTSFWCTDEVVPVVIGDKRFYRSVTFKMAADSTVKYIYLDLISIE